MSTLRLGPRGLARSLIKEGDEISIDGSTGEVFLGRDARRAVSGGDLHRVRSRRQPWTGRTTRPPRWSRRSTGC